VPDLVAFDLPPSAELVQRIGEVLDAGDAFCIIDQRLDHGGKQAQLDLYRPTIVIDHSGELVRFDHGVGTEPGDALCCATSGSSGTPKVAVLTLDALKASATMTSRALGVDPTAHRWLSCLPWAHIGGLTVALRSLFTGTPISVLPHFDADTVRECAAATGATHTSLVATALSRIDAGQFTSILLGGAAPPRALPPNVTTTYGMTETGSGVVYNNRALPGVSLAVHETTGELLVKSPTLLRTYRNAPLPFTNGPDGDSAWLSTGDAGSVSDDGYVTVKGRIDEVISTGGEKVHPNVVERALGDVPYFVELTVWKRPDPTWGERVVVFAVPTDNRSITVNDLAPWTEHLAPWERPKEVVLLPALPRTPSGKVARKLLS
jgi:O-succinylbenzoic acid--CoA ligase